MYASIALTILFYLCVLAYTRRAWIRKNLVKFSSIITGTLVLIATIFVIAQIATEGRFLLTLYARFYVFLNIQYLGFDISWQIRWSEIQRVLENFNDSWLFGQGFGTFTISRSRFEMQLTVDNSYAYLLWKSGIMGLLSFLYMYFVFLRRGVATLKKRVSPQDKVFIITALVNAIGLMLVGMTNSSIAHYRLILVWASLFACIEVIARRYD
jgi:O-antigen ligase